MKTKNSTIRKKGITLFCLVLISVLFAGTVFAQGGFSVLSVKGKAYVRKGIEEQWILIKTGQKLKPEDTILTGKDCKIVLSAPQKTEFVISTNTLLDIADIRPLSVYELLLFLTDKELDKIPYEEKLGGMSKTKIGVIHGDEKLPELDQATTSDKQMLSFKLAGIDALLDNSYTESAIAKFRVITSKYGLKKEFLQLALRTGTELEKLNLPGNAREVYEEIVEAFPQDTAAKTAKEALEKLQ